MVTEVQCYQFVDGNKMMVEHWRRVLPDAAHKVGQYEIVDGKCSCAGGQHGKECKHVHMLAHTYFKDSVASWQLPFIADALRADNVDFRLVDDLPAKVRSAEIRQAGVAGLRVYIIRCKSREFVVYVEKPGGLK